MDESTSSVNLDTTAIKEQVEVTIDRLDYTIQCGVCDEEMSHTMWIEHIGKEHTYLAWKKGEEPLVCIRIFLFGKRLFSYVIEDNKEENSNDLCYRYHALGLHV